MLSTRKEPTTSAACRFFLHDDQFARAELRSWQHPVAISVWIATVPHNYISHLCLARGRSSPPELSLKNTCTITSLLHTEQSPGSTCNGQHRYRTRSMRSAIPSAASYVQHMVLAHNQSRLQLQDAILAELHVQSSSFSTAGAYHLPLACWHSTNLMCRQS